jgi:hypothetical protein
MLVARDQSLKFEKDQDFAVQFEGDSVCMLKVGDVVEESTVVFEGQSSHVLQSMHISRELGVPPSDIKEFVSVSDGEIVEKGEVVAKRSVSMGMMEKIVKNNLEGRLSYRQIDSGVVDIMSPFSDKTVTAGVTGRVRRVVPESNQKREVILSVNGYVSKPVFCSGESVSGSLYILKTGDSVYFPEDVTSDCRGKIVVAGRELNLMLYESIVEAGAIGVIVGGVSRTDFSSMGHKAIPIFVMEGWGTVPLDNILIEFFRNSAGKPVYLDVSSEKIGVYNPDYEGTSDRIGYDFLVDIEEGMKVQVWDLPYWGYSGTVENVMDEEDLLQVKFSSGRKILVDPGSTRVIE